MIQAINLFLFYLLLSLLLYVGVISYIYALENDSDLAFRIENFKMTASGENVTATFTVNNVAIKAETVSGSSSATSTNTTVQ